MTLIKTMKFNIQTLTMFKFLCWLLSVRHVNWRTFNWLLLGETSELILFKDSHVEGCFSKFMKTLSAKMLWLSGFRFCAFWVQLDCKSVLFDKLWTIPIRMILNIFEFILRPQVASNWLNFLTGLSSEWASSKLFVYLAVIIFIRIEGVIIIRFFIFFIGLLI